MERTQERSHIEIATPVQDAQILLRSFTTEERLGRPFRIDADLLIEREIPLEDLLGHNVTIRLTPDLGRDLHMYFNGFISRLAHVELEAGLWVYHATIVPWVWFLTRSADCMIFQNKSVPEIIEEVFRDKGFSDFENELSETYEPREYCVQYRETDFDFITRLMEEEGIYYYFRQENGKHTLVLADSPAAHAAIPGRETIIFRARDEGSSGAGLAIEAWSVAAQVLPGAVVLNDFDFTNPQPGRLIGRGIVQRTHGAADYEVFDYPGQYLTPEAGERYSRLRIESLHAEYEIFSGSTSVRELAPGWTFELEGHPREDQNREYLITGVQRRVVDSAYTDDGEPMYESEFTTIKADEPFRLPRITPKRLVHGPQTAIVVGPDGQELHTDEHGRVKVQFHWDRAGAGNQDSSCFVRVAQGLAGNRWGSIFLPRIGQEVIVEFLEGDPDRPLITGRVYNGRNMPPYPLPDNATVSTTKTNTSPDGDGYNEIRFEDKKDSEQIFIHAQRRMDVRIRGSLFRSVGGNREERVGHEEEGDLNTFVHHDQNTIISNARYEKIDDVEHRIVTSDIFEKFDLNHAVFVAETSSLNATDILIESSDTMHLGSAETRLTGSQKLDLKGAAIKAEGTRSIDVKSPQLKLTGDSVLDAKGGTVNVQGRTVNIKGDMKVNIEGSAGVSLKCGGNAVVIDPSGVSIQGTIVKINMGAASAAAGSAAAASGAEEAEHVEEVEMLEPIEAYGATTALPGQRVGGGGGGGSAPSRTHRRILVEPRRFPPTPPPPGATPAHVGPGGAGTVDDEIELVELVEVIRHSGSDVERAPQARRQYINMAAADDKPEHTRIIRVRARIRWRDGREESLSGKSVFWYVEPGASNRQDLSPAGLKHGFDSDGGAERKSTTTDADGWTPTVEFHTSQYGGDEFTLRATLESGYTGGLPAGAYTVWRKLFYEVDCMQRVDGGTFSNMVNEAGLRAEMARNFLEIVKVGRDSTPTYRRVLMSSDARSWAASIRDQDASPRYFQLLYVDTIAQRFEQAVPAGSSDKSLTLEMRRPGVANDNRIPLPADTYCIDASNWFRAGRWSQPSTGRSGTLAQAKFTLTERPDYATANDGWDVTVDLAGLGDPGDSLEITLDFKSMNSLSGLNTGIETIVGLRFRETRYGRGSADAIASTQRTSTHEPGHAMGMVATTMPDGTAHPTVISTQGTHCTYETDQCCMFRSATNFVTTFCPHCSDALRGRKLESIPLRGSAAYT